LKLAD